MSSEGAWSALAAKAMRQRPTTVFTLACALCSLALLLLAPTDEGMWMPNLIKTLNQTDMQNSGLQLSADEIYSINNSSLKDAVVALNGGGCTAE